MNKLFLSILFLFILISCSKDYSPDSLVGEWEVVKYENQSNESAIKAEEGLTVTINADSTLLVNKTRNTCNFAYVAENDGALSLNVKGCTYICCDEEWEDQVVKMMAAMTDFVVKGRKLTISGAGEIILKKN